MSRQELDDRVTRFRSAGRGEGVSADKLPGLANERRALYSKIQMWQQDQRQNLPQLGGGDESPTSSRRSFEDDLENFDAPQDGPELEAFGLPSSWKAESLFGDDEESYLVAAWELSLRVGHAYDLLATIRISVRQRAALIKDKQKNAHGQKDNLRAQVPITTVAARSRFLAAVYNQNFDKMHHLHTLLTTQTDLVSANTPLPLHPSSSRDGISIDQPDAPSSPSSRSLPAIPTNLRRIDAAKDLHARDLTVARSSGDSKKTLSWIFQVSGPQATKEHGHEDWETEGVFLH